MSKARDAQIFQKIIELQQDAQQVKPKTYYSSFMVHVILKVIPICFFLFQWVLKAFFSQTFITQLLILFIVIEFWFTKNIIGKRMLGMFWYFGEDQYGVERLKFEVRANPQFIDMFQPKLFWIVQIAYCIIPFLFVFALIIIIPNLLGVPLRNIVINSIMLASALINTFYFWQISSPAGQRQHLLRTRLGMDYVRKLGLGSITGYY